MTERDRLRPVQALARRHGVAVDYVDGLGRRCEVPDSTLVAVLGALGVDPAAPASTSAVARSAVATSAVATSAVAARRPDEVVASGRCAPGPQPPRSWGVFAPVPALRLGAADDHGSGDLAALAALADAVAARGGSVVATLPLMACRPDEASPYSPLTRRWWDERWVDPQWVADRVGVGSRWMDRRPTRPPTAYEPAPVWSQTREALAEILELAGGAAGVAYLVGGWRGAHRDVELWARWKAAAVLHGWDPARWPGAVGPAVRDGGSAALGADAVEFEIFAQWAVSARIAALGAQLRARSMALYLDLPLSVASGSFDVWADPGRFAAGVSIGAPPDKFFPDGQSWGLRPVNPVTERRDGFPALREALDAHLEVCGLLRIDHVMGLHRQFWIPDGADSADGTYVDYPAAEQWAVVGERSRRSGVGIVGEDLGVVPQEVREAMAGAGARGLFIGQDEVRSPFRLGRPVPASSVASLNTHDLPPVAAWYRDDAIAQHGPAPAAPLEVVRNHLVAELAASGADVVLVSEQDLSLDARRFNVPGRVGGETWRLRATSTVADLASTGPLGDVLDRVDAWRRTPPGAWPPGSSPRLDTDDLASLRAGTHACLADRLGAHPFTAAGMVGAAVSVWAPRARDVVVAGDFDGWTGVPLARRTDEPDAGVWDGFVPAAVLGDRYKLRIHGADGHWAEKADPFARASELPPGNASVLTADDPAEHRWRDADWMASRQVAQASGHPMSIYEVQLGSWRHHADGRVPTYREVAPWLIDYVRSLGFTHVELMPVMEHPFGGSWGYHVTGYFAPTARHGTPADFAFLVDELHRAGIGVILDWVPAHFPDDAFGLADFDGQPLFEHPDPREGRHPEWGSRVFDWGRPEVRAFLVSSARWWIERYHVDGLRVDAVASMLYRDYGRSHGGWVANRYGGREHLEAIDVVRQLTTEIHSSVPGAMVIAEESTSWPRVTHPTAEGGLGFDLKWDLGWMHDMLEYLGRNPVHRSWHHDDLTFRSMYANSERFVLPLSHDEVVHGKGSLVNKMAGDDWQRRANLRLLFGHQYCVPGVPLLFMGGELAMNEEWNHDDALPWYLLDHHPHASMRDWVAELNRLLRTVPALSERDDHHDGFEWIDCADRANSVLVWLRRAARTDDTVVVAANFTPTPHSGYRIGLPHEGRWHVLANSDEERWGGSGHPTPAVHETVPEPIGVWHQSALITLPPLGLLILGREES